MNKKSFWKGFTLGGILFVIAATVFYFKFALQPDISLNQVEVSDLEGNKVELIDHVGKPLIVNFWASWCAPCLQEFPHIEEVKQELGDEVTFLMVSDEALEKTIKFSNTKPYSFTYLHSTKTLDQYGISALPTTYFYDAKGNLVTKHTSNMTKEDLYELIKLIQ